MSRKNGDKETEFDISNISTVELAEKCALTRYGVKIRELKKEGRIEHIRIMLKPELFGKSEQFRPREDIQPPKVKQPLQPPHFIA